MIRKYNHSNRNDRIKKNIKFNIKINNLFLKTKFRRIISIILLLIILGGLSTGFYLGVSYVHRRLKRRKEDNSEDNGNDNGKDDNGKDDKKKKDPIVLIILICIGLAFCCYYIILAIVGLFRIIVYGKTIYNKNNKRLTEKLDRHR